MYHKNINETNLHMDLSLGDVQEEKKGVVINLFPAYLPFSLQRKL